MISPNYTPEPFGIAPIVTSAAEWLTRQGHRVEVVTAFPNYPERRIHTSYRRKLWLTETLNGVDVRRSWLRAGAENGIREKALYELSMAAFQTPQMVAPIVRSDVVVAVVPTLVSASVAIGLARLVRRPTILWVQDLVARAAEAVADSRASRVMVTAVSALEKQVAHASTHVIVCSPGFKEHLEQKGLPARCCSVVPNWTNVRAFPVEGPRLAQKRLRLLYSGNLGYTQGVETLVSAAEFVCDIADIEIAGAGNGAAAVISAARGARNVAVRRPVPDEEYPALLASADVLVLTQRRVAAGANLPSKIATYMASGRPIIASIASGTPAADLLRASGGAHVVEPENPAALAAAIRRLAEDAESRIRMGRASRAYAEQQFAQERVLPQLDRLLLTYARDRESANR